MIHESIEICSSDGLTINDDLKRTIIEAYRNELHGCAEALYSKSDFRKKGNILFYKKKKKKNGEQLFERLFSRSRVIKEMERTERV